jgi:hypothetical protein
LKFEDLVREHCLPADTNIPYYIYPTTKWDSLAFTFIQECIKTSFGFRKNMRSSKPKLMHPHSVDLKCATTKRWNKVKVCDGELHLKFVFG